MPVDLPELHPALAQSWWWWLVVAGLVVAGLALITVGIVRWRTLRRVAPVISDDSLERLREATLAAVDEVPAADPAERVRLIGREVRRFAGIATDGDADFQTTAQLRIAAAKDPVLQPVFELSETVDRLAYGGATEAQAGQLAERAREVIRSWR